MKRFQYFFLMAVYLLTWPACLAAAGEESGAPVQGGMTLSLDELYASPSLIGTRPTGIAWSRDSRHVAFLWNDEGYAFRDIWTYSVADGRPERVTFHGRDDGRALHTGISGVTWLPGPDGGFAYILDGAIHLHGPSGTVTVVARGEGLRDVRVSPDGRKLGFVSRDGLWVYPLSGGDGSSASQLLALRDKQAVSRYEWVPDSDELVFSITDNGPLPQRDIHYYTRHGLQVDRVDRAFPGQDTQRYLIGVVGIAADPPRYFERPDERDYIWNWGVSENGKLLFVNSSDLLVKHHRIQVYDIAGGSRNEFYHEFDPKHLRPDWRADWAPGDQGLVIQTDRDGYLHLYHQENEQSLPRQLTAGEWEISNFWVDRERGQLYFLGNTSGAGDRLLYRVSFNGGEIERVGSEANGMHAPVFSPDMKYAASIWSDDMTPHDLYVIDTETGQTRQVTRSPQDLFFEQQWAEVRYIRFPSRQDGTELVGRLSLPPDFEAGRKYPLIVGSVYSDSVLNQWGGRQSHPTWGLDQYLVAQGYILLNVNVRGSWGQGRKHNQGLRYGYGVVDIEDLHSGVRHLVETGYADPERVGIWGSSYGGLMTMMSLFKKPGVYAAGIAGAPATNVAHAYPGQMWVMGEPTGDDQPQRYEQQSPLYHTGGLADPLMIIHGSKDQVVLYSDTIAVIDRLIENQQLFELVTLPGVGHGWDNEAPEVRLFSFKKMVEFFNRHLSCPDPGAACRNGSSESRQ